VSQHEISGPAELRITGSSPDREVVLIVGGGDWTRVDVSYGLTVVTTWNDQPAAFLIRPGESVFLEPEQPGMVYAMVFSPRSVGTSFQETGDLSRYPLVASFDQDQYMTALIVEGMPGESIVVDLMSDEIDSFLIGSLPDGRALMDDDGGSGLNSHLELQLDADGRAAILASSLGGEPGPYELVIASLDQVSQDTDGGIVQPGTSVSGSITSLMRIPGVGNAITYQVPVSAKQEVTIDLVSTDFDAYLIVRMPDGREYWDDDSGSGLNSQLVLMPDGTGMAEVVVTSCSGDDTGTFSLRVQSGPSGGASGGPSGGTSGGSLESDIGLMVAESIIVGYGTSWLSGAVATDYVCYRLDVQEAGDLTMEVLVTAIYQGTRWEDDDSMLFLFDDRGGLIDSDDDSGEGGASLIEDTYVTSGTYYVIVTTYPNLPNLTPDQYLVDFYNDGGSDIEFDLRIELQ
jgi:hypothetical protein